MKKSVVSGFLKLLLHGKYLLWLTHFRFWQTVVVSKSTREILGRNFDYIFVFLPPSNSTSRIQVILVFTSLLKQTSTRLFFRTLGFSSFNYSNSASITQNVLVSLSWVCLQVLENIALTAFYYGPSFLGALICLWGVE